MMALLDLTNVRAGYGTGPDILADVSLEIEEGRTYCIIGPNGAGKSTLLKTISGVIPPREGEIVFDGVSIGALRPDQILSEGVCFVPQDRTLFPEMTVRENLVMGAYLVRDRKLIDERTQFVFDLFPQLAERSSQMAQTMSGGEQQMLAMARALMIKPRLMMIDEPSLGLAPQISDTIFGTIGRLATDLGITVLLIEQNVKKGIEVSDWVFVLDLGSKRFEGPADTILDDPRIRDLYLGKLAGATQKGGEGTE
ncbi:MAG: ATP-binding cassette domain-containing protein [Acidimicrobiia bacterium]|nr:ATP-binding cassette domain-containing protein [Acidimicrobiia bacterium]